MQMVEAQIRAAAAVRAAVSLAPPLFGRRSNQTSYLSRQARAKLITAELEGQRREMQARGWF
jgi:hypothetical protein